MVIVRDFERPASEHVESLSEYGSATVHEALGTRNAMEPAVGPIASNATVCGPACTVRVPPGDNAMVHAAADIAAAGDVLVVGAESHRAAIWGELTTRNARRQGVSGLVTDGNVRDTDYLANAEFPVFAAATSQAGAVKETPGAVNVPVSVGGVTVAPGDVVVGDRDGVTVVPRDRVEDAVDAAAAVAEHEERLRRRIAEGETLAELLGVHELIDDHDVRVVESPADR